MLNQGEAEEKEVIFEDDMAVKHIQLNRIEQNENSRVVYKAADLSELMESMRANGLLQAVGLKKIGTNKFEAVYGNRRIVAARKLGWKEIPARLLDAPTDVDRDIIGLIENIKRQNTSPAEDGRMFASLMDRGLSIDEIASRVAISSDRVNLALDVFNHIPKEYQKLIKNRVTGVGVKKANEISATAAKAILDIRRRHGLTKKQTTGLLDYAQKENVAANKLEHITPLIKQGFTVSQAIAKASALTRVVLYVYMDQRNVDKLEKKYETNVSDLLWKQLEQNKELDVTRTLRGDADRQPGKLRTIARLSAEA